MRTLQRKCGCGKVAPSGGACPSCLARESAAGTSAWEPAPAIVHDVLESPGRPLDRATRAVMERGFQRDFSRVRIHTGDRAAASANAIGARAYTAGEDIAFGRDAYQPGSAASNALVAHELAHVRTPGRKPGEEGQPLAIAPMHHPAEQGANRQAMRAMRGMAVESEHSASVPNTVHRQASNASQPTGASNQTAPPAPPRRTYVGFTRSGFGEFDATIEPRGAAPGGAPGYTCALLATTKVKFVPNGQWPTGAFGKWTNRFAEVVSRHWSTRYLLVPERPCPNEGCSAIVVYVKVEPVSSGQHHIVKVDYDKPSDARSDVSHFYRDDLGGHTAVHETGHLFGLEHIGCPRNDDVCYGSTRGEGDDVMGRRNYVSARDYAPFVEVANALTSASCQWRTPEGQGGPHTQSFLGPLAALFGLAGGFGGLALALGAGLSALPFAGVVLGGLALGAGLGALIGFGIDRS